MLRAVVREFGPASKVVKLESYAWQELSPAQVRVRMRARSINPSDLITISGAYRSRTSLPFYPGFEGVGVVEAIGADVQDIPIGARVLPIGTAGTWAETKDGDAAWCLRVPEGLDDAQAATSYVNPMTAWLMLHEAISLTPNLQLGITAAASTIGIMLIKLANRAGIAPIAFVRSAASAARLDGLNLSEVVVGSYASPCTLDAVLDCIGGVQALELSRTLRPGGAFICYGLLSGQPIPTGFWAARPDIAFRFFHLREWVHKADFAAVQAAYDQVTALMMAGAISSEIAAQLPLSDISQALDMATRAQTPGKILLVS